MAQSPAFTLSRIADSSNSKSTPAPASSLALSSSSSTPPLQFDQVRALVDECGQAGDFAPAVRRIGAVFGDVNAFELSFLTHTSSDSADSSASATAVPPSDADAAIDFDELEEICGLMEACAVHDVALSALARMTAERAFAKPAAAASPHCLRKYLVILALPWWTFLSAAAASSSAAAQHRAIMAAVVRSLSGAGEPAKATLTSWLARYPAPRLGEALARLHDFIEATYEHGTSAHRQQHIPDAVIAMQLLHAANQRSRALVAADAFYNESINAPGFNLRADFANWTTRERAQNFTFCKYAFVLSPATKSRILEVDAAAQMHRALDQVVMEAMLAGQRHIMPYLVLEVNRATLIADTLTQLQLVSGADLKKKLKVKFIGEDGVDAGGVAREFFAIMIRDLFNVQYGMFEVQDESNCVWFNASAMEENASEYELIGQLLGLAIFNSVLLDIHFPRVVYQKLLRKRVELDDLRTLDPPMWRALHQLLAFDGDVADVYARTFTVERPTAFGGAGDVEVIELTPGGAQIELTNANRAEYVRLYVDWRLNASVHRQFKPFEDGFWSVAGGDALRLFAAEELEMVICGSPEIDFHAMEAAAVYEAPLNADHRLIRDFWRAVHSLEGDKRGQFLLFSTGSDRVPIKGLGTLKLTISPSGGGPDRLLSSHTCFNHLLLPPYATYEILRDRLLQSIENCEGFGLI